MRYPLVMNHPAHQKAEVQTVEKFDPNRPADQQVQLRQARPERYPPVTVHTSDQEEMYRSQGYVPFGEAPPPIADFSDYPVMLSHPDYVAEIPDETVAERDPQTKQITTFVIKGKPAQFPPMVANDAAEEKALAKKGYRRQGQSDPTAASRRAAGTTLDYKPQQYPMAGSDGQVVTDPSLPPSGPAQYPMWINTGKRDAEGNPIGVMVNSAAEELQVRRNLTPAEFASAPVFPVSGETPRAAVPQMTRGQRAAATRAANRARKAAEAQPAA